MSRGPRKVDRHALRANPYTEQAVRGFSAGTGGDQADGEGEADLIPSAREKLGRATGFGLRAERTRA